MTKTQKLARWLIAEGYTIVPTYPGERSAKFGDWSNLATNQLSVWESWEKNGYPGEKESKVDLKDTNIIIVSKHDGIGGLDIDDLAECQRQGMPALPRGVFLVKTPSGGYHLPFKHTDETRALGSYGYVPEDPDTKMPVKILELKGHNAGWCAPYQTRADGGEYKPECEGDTLVGLPADLIEWYKAHANNSGKATACKFEFAEDFATSDFCEANKATELDQFEENGATMVTVESCPLCDEQARQRKKGALTKFIFGGKGYGFKCHYCGISSREEFEQQMAQKYSDWEPYDGDIYAWSEADDADFEGGFDVEEVGPERNEEPVEVVTMPIKPDFSLPRVSAATRAVIDQTLKEDEEHEEDERSVAVAAPAVVSAELFAQLTSAEERKKSYVDSKPQQIPESAMYGQMAKWARAMDLPLSIAYPAILTCYSALPKYETILGVRFNLYCAIMMPVGGGKNLALNRSVKILGLREDQDYMDATIGGAGGLFNAIGEHVEGKGKQKVVIPGPRKMLINPAEFAATMINCKLDNSTLAPHLCNFWDKDRVSSPVGQSKREANCRLSILGALPIEKDAPEAFQKYFGEETGKGLHSRFLFGYHDEKIDNRWAERWVYQEEISGDFTEVGVATQPPLGWTAEAEDHFSRINLPNDWDSRGLYNLKRIALLCAAANGDQRINRECVQAAELFMLWQMQLKNYFRYGTAERATPGELSTTIMEAFSRIAAEGKYDRSPVIKGNLNINVARVIYNLNWKKFGIEAVSRTIQSLIKAGQIQQGFRVNTKGKIVPSKQHIVVTDFSPE